MTNEELTCNDCQLYFGEECHGKHEGREVYDDSEACDGIELEGDV